MDSGVKGNHLSTFHQQIDTVGVLNEDVGKMEWKPGGDPSMTVADQKNMSLKTYLN